MPGLILFWDIPFWDCLLPDVGRTIYSPEQERLITLLRETRRAAGMTQSALAERLERPQSFVSKVETGERRADLVELHAICKALGVSLTSFVERFEAAIKEPKRPARARGRSGP